MWVVSKQTTSFYFDDLAIIINMKSEVRKHLVCNKPLLLQNYFNLVTTKKMFGVLTLTRSFKVENVGRSLKLYNLVTLRYFGTSFRMN